MQNKKKRPVYLNLLQIRLPVGGVASILHRATGAVLVLLLPFALYLLQRSVQEPAASADIAARLTTIEGRVVLLGTVWMFAQHFFSGLRHLLMDVGIGDDTSTARISAWLTFVASGSVVVVTGICL
jgi:succinate dehydrogenase / fumarate reductase cytochrome b subunit